MVLENDHIWSSSCVYDLFRHGELSQVKFPDLSFLLLSKQALGPIRWLLASPKINVPLLHHYQCLARQISVVHRLDNWLGLLADFFFL